MSSQATAGQQLFGLYRNLREHFGYASRWWPGTPDEIVLTAVLVQQCNWNVAWEAVTGLRAQGLTSPTQLAAAEESRIAKAIGRVTFAPTKTRRLRQIAGTLVEGRYASFGDLLNSATTDELRPRLLALPGFGRETTDAVLLYAGTRHPVFVVDAYTRRIFERIPLKPGVGLSWAKANYEAVREYVERCVRDCLPQYAELDFADDVPLEVAVLRDLHAQLVELGRHHCHRGNPRCRQTGAGGWPGYDICATHCQAEICTQCPVAGDCASLRAAGPAD